MAFQDVLVLDNCPHHQPEAQINLQQLLHLTFPALCNLAHQQIRFLQQLPFCLVQLLHHIHKLLHLPQSSHGFEPGELSAMSIKVNLQNQT